MLLWCFPLVIVAMQLLPAEHAFIIGFILLLLGLTKRLRALLLFGLTVFGYLFWLLAAQYFTATISNLPLLIVLNRLGLIGYIVLFAIWLCVQPCAGYLKPGNLKATLKAPFIWWGASEYAWRFVLIACFAWVVPTVIFTFLHGYIFEFMPYALLFAVINPVFEGVLWHGLILGRVVDYAGEKQGLILSAVAFGLYHLSLGFSVWVCLLFAIGGFYMGGLAIKSKGLLAPTILHVFVNLALVSFGIIF